MLSDYALDLLFGFDFTHCLANILHVACGLNPRTLSCYMHCFVLFIQELFLDFQITGSCIIENI